MPYVLRRTRYKRARAMVERSVRPRQNRGGLKKFGRADRAGIRGVRTSSHAHTVCQLARARASVQRLLRYLYTRLVRAHCDWRHLYSVQLALLPR